LLQADALMRALFVWGHARAFINHALGIGRLQIADALYKATKEKMGRFPPVLLEGVPYDENYTLRRAADAAWADQERRLSPIVKKLIGSRGLSKREATVRIAAIAAATPRNTAIVLPPPVSPDVRARLYVQLAERYEVDNRLKEALELWRAASLLVGLREASQAERGERIGYTAVAT